MITKFHTYSDILKELQNSKMVPVSSNAVIYYLPNVEFSHECSKEAVKLDFLKINRWDLRHSLKLVAEAYFYLGWMNVQNFTELAIDSFIPPDYFPAGHNLLAIISIMISKMPGNRETAIFNLQKKTVRAMTDFINDEKETSTKFEFLYSLHDMSTFQILVDKENKLVHLSAFADEFRALPKTFSGDKHTQSSTLSFPERVYVLYVFLRVLALHLGYTPGTLNVYTDQLLYTGDEEVLLEAIADANKI